MPNRKFIEVKKADEIIIAYRDEETESAKKETSLKRLERAYDADHIGQLLIESDLSVTEEDIVRPYLDKLKNQLIQDIQNGVIHISSGNEKLFSRIEDLI